MKSSNVKWHDSKVLLEEIEERNGHKGCVVWMTGLSASGKSTLAVELEKKLFDMGLNAFVLDGDNLRYGLNSDLGFSPEDREENIRRIAEISKLFQTSGAIIISAFISPYKKDRMFAREIVQDGRFCQVYVKCSIGECERRDPKGLYKKARIGEIENFTGVSAPYEVPERPEIVIDTEIDSVEESVEYLINKLKVMNIF